MAAKRGGAEVWFVLLGLLWLFGCNAGHPSSEQIKDVNHLFHDRAPLDWDVARLFKENESLPPEPTGELTLRAATELALSHNLALIASSENLSIAHAQLVQAGLIQNPTIGESSGLLFPISPHGGYPSVDGNISEVLNSIFTQSTRVNSAKVQELQANIDMATQAYLLAQQVDGKYQEMIELLRRKKLAQRTEDLYARAVKAAEARQRVGIIATPELNRARLDYQDARRMVMHLTTQYARASGEMNWLMGYSTMPAWHLPQTAVEDVGEVPKLPAVDSLEQIGGSYRLDLLRADFDRRVGQRGIELAKLGMIPQITVGAEVARDSQHNVVGGPWLVGITLPIFDPGFVALELAKAQARKAEKTYRALAGQVHQDIRTALANWRIAADDVTFYRQSLIPQQEENIRLMEMSFRLGNDDLDTLLNVYQSYVSQLQSYEDAIQAYHDSAVALQQAVGLTWDRIITAPAAALDAGPSIGPATTEPTTQPVINPESTP